MENLLKYFPEVEVEELSYLSAMTKDFSDEKLSNFAMYYKARRKDSILILITTLLGFIWISGVQRFILGQIGMGILYLFTLGLCFIGTIVDLINYKKLTLEHNQKIASEVILLMK